MHSFIRSQFLAVLVAAVPAAPPAANVLTVDCNRGDSVTEVVAGAVSGGTVVVNGTCHETVVIPPNLVDVIVDGQGLAIVNPPSTGTAARVPRHGFYVRG